MYVILEYQCHLKILGNMAFMVKQTEGGGVLESRTHSGMKNDVSLFWAVLSQASMSWAHTFDGEWPCLRNTNGHILFYTVWLVLVESLSYKNK